jgi:hypothetical protein
MACDLTIWDTATKSKKVVVCDEENAGKIIVDEHAARAPGQYRDAAGQAFTADWTKCRLIGFCRRRAEK